MLPDLARVRRRIIALQDPNQPNVVDTVLDRVERLEQARQPVTRDAQGRSDFLSRRSVGRLLGGAQDSRLPVRIGFG
jgi:hypothetical protein